MLLSRSLSVSIAAATAIAACAVATTASSAPGGTASAQLRSDTTSVAPATSLPGTYTSKVFGTFGRAGTVRGHFKPVRSFVRNGTAVVQGDLTAKLRRGNGTLIGVAHRHDVTLPVKAPGAHISSATSAAVPAAAATCTILHLVLGPLDLNLLGLHVHLNRVVLDITAVSGAGNLLGNLLCAVAHLLDNTSPSLLDVLRLSSLLSRVIGLIT